MIVIHVDEVVECNLVVTNQSLLDYDCDDEGDTKRKHEFQFWLGVSIALCT